MQNKISSLEIKNKFLKYFEQNDHMQISDSSIVPKNDPTLLFINSGIILLEKTRHHAKGYAMFSRAYGQ